MLFIAKLFSERQLLTSYKTTAMTQTNQPIEAHLTYKYPHGLIAVA